MRRIIAWSATSIAASLVLLAVVATAAEKDKKISLDKAPKAVQDAIKARFPDGEVTSVEKETEDGKVVYDVELKLKGRKYEMDILEDGTVIEIEKEIAAKDLPEAVSKALDAKYPKSTIKEVMEVYKVKDKDEKLTEYEVTLETADKEAKEVKVSLDGKSIKEE
jgi:Peptidase propeptide and YPEB domain